MTKLKTSSSAKKRFKITGSGNVLATQANKRHNMRKRSIRQLKNQQGMVALNEVEAARVLSYMPYSCRKKSRKKNVTQCCGNMMNCTTTTACKND